MTVKKLKKMFMDKYGDSIFPNKLPEIIITLTREQYEELNQDLISMTGSGILLLIDENEMTNMKPEEILYTKIHIPRLCEFLIQLGQEFSFELIDKDLDYGEETL